MGNTRKSRFGKTSITLILIVGWTAVVGSFLYMTILREQESNRQIAQTEARAHFQRDQSFRHWIASHGGVYVPVDENTPANTYLSHLPYRDISKPDGTQLTLMNPAYAIRQMNEGFSHYHGVRGHITSLETLRPENAPDNWERKALMSFEEGKNEAFEFTEIDGEPYLRLMQPMITDVTCLKCHEHQGYKVGDVRGGVSISLPVASLMANQQEHIENATYAFGTIWLVGVTLILSGSWIINKRTANQEKAEEEIRQLQLSKEIAEASARVKSEFLANMSHEIRTPMTAILGYTAVLLENRPSENFDSKSIDTLQTIKSSGEHLLQILNDILDLSKLDSGMFSVDQVPFSPIDVIDDVLSLMQVRAHSKDIPIIIQHKGPIPSQIRSDPCRLRQILINLLGNAIKFTEKGSIRIVIELLRNSTKPPQLKFDIIDSGIGMNAVQISQIFEPFTQIDASTTRMHSGTGLGLAISKRLAEMLGGDIAVDSAIGSGSVFSLTIETGSLENIPILDIDLTISPDVDPSNKSKVSVLPTIDCRVLLAEDTLVNQRLITVILQNAGATVTAVENGQIALDEVLVSLNEEHPYDIVLMDMQMPIMDGYTATKRLRDSGYVGPIIALTAHAMKGDEEKCLQAGCDAYHTKPIEPANLVLTIAQFLSGYRIQDEHPLFHSS